MLKKYVLSKIGINNANVDNIIEHNMPAVKKTKLFSCAQRNKTSGSWTYTCEFMQVKNHAVALCVANRLHRTVIWQFTSEESMLH
jgi:hypothetical protein